MALPGLNELGDLPPGVHQATLDEVVERFGRDQGQRGLCTRRLLHIYALAQRTGNLQRFIIFGSYVTAKLEPNDVECGAGDGMMLFDWKSALLSSGGCLITL